MDREFIPAQAGPDMQRAVVSGISLIWTQWESVNNRLESCSFIVLCYRVSTGWLCMFRSMVNHLAFR